MKIQVTTLRIGCSLALASIALLAGCSKKDAPAETTQAAPPAKSEVDALVGTMKKDGDAMAARVQDTAARTLAEKKAALEQPSVELLAKYSSQIDALTSGVAALKKVVDQNANLLPADVQTKYQELQTLVPQVTSLFSSLKGYQGADLAGIVSRIQTDLGSAQKLYGEIRGMLPPTMGGTVPKL